jgi:hypothetical protein
MSSPAEPAITPWRIIRTYLLQREYADTKALFDAIKKHNANYKQKAFHNLLTRAKQRGNLKQPKKFCYALTQHGRGDVTGPEELNKPIAADNRPKSAGICPVIPERAQQLWGQTASAPDAPTPDTKGGGKPATSFPAPPCTAPNGYEWVINATGRHELAKITWRDKEPAEKGFYMVYLQGRNAPCVQHLTEDAAQDEATRLARKEKCTAYVLKAVAKIELAEQPVTKTELA